MKKILVVIIIISLSMLVGCDFFIKRTANNKNEIDIQSNREEGKILGIEKIKEIALEKSGGGNVTKIEYDGEDREKVYEGEIVKDKLKFDFEINAITGEFLKWKEEKEYQSSQGNLKIENEPDFDMVIGTEKAKKVVLNKLDGGKIIKIEYDGDDGFGKYEGKVIKDKVKYDFEINAVTGEIVKWEIDRD